MSAQLSQDRRIASLTTNLGANTLACSKFDGEEGLNELFEYRIEVVSQDDNIDFDSIIGTNCTLTLKSYGETERKFDGILIDTEWLGWNNAYYVYRLRLRPWLWLTSRTSTSRIFSDMTALDIVKQVLNQHGFAQLSDQTTSNYPTLEYTVQYRETDMNFVMRLMEQHGIYYFFEHQDGQHTMVLADSKSSHSTGPGGAELLYRPLIEADRRNEELVYSWIGARSHNTGKYVLNDYDYLQPNASLEAEDQASSGYSEADLEMYDYPGRYTDPGAGTDYARVRLEAEQAKDFRRRAKGDAASLTPGCLVSLIEHPNGAENQEYLILRCKHSFTNEEYRSGAGISMDEEAYYGTYEVMPSERPFRAPLRTVKPRVHGSQTAKVVGDGEIDVDEHGRILVEFFWDRDRSQSRRVRLMQQWADQGWGVIFIPRVGMEVVIQYLEGDPDQPLCIGCVYNAEKTVPYSLPDQKTIAGWKSNSTPGGGGYNEFYFDDASGSELIRMHGQKDHSIEIENDEDRLVKNDVTTETGRDRTQTIGRHHTEDVGVNHTETIGNNHTEDVGMNWEKTIGMQTTIDTGMTTEITSGMMMTLKVGGSKIVMTPASIEIKSAMITVNGVMTTVKGSAILTLKGGLVMIN